MKKDVSSFQEVSTLCIECITPVNIADGTKLYSKEYLFDNKQGKVYFLNQLAWHKFIYTNKLLPAYEKYLTAPKGLEKRGLLDWLRNYKYDIKDVQGAIKSHTNVFLSQLHFKDKESLNEIICQEKLSTGEAYVPGSSIKGVIRTAILFDLLQKNPQTKQDYWQKVRGILLGGEPDSRKWKRGLEEQASLMETELLHKLELKVDKEKPVKKSSAVCSVMRGISCSDALSKEDVTTAVLQKIDVSFDRKTHKVKGKPLPTFRECILPGNKFYCSLKIEKAVTSSIGITSVNELLAVLDRFFNFTNEIFEKAFKGDYSDVFHDINSANAYLGSNTGFLTKTLMAALAPTQQEAVEVIRSWLNFTFRQHKHIPLDKHISPRTLKTTAYNGKKYLMGLVMVYKDE